MLSRVNLSKYNDRDPLSNCTQADTVNNRTRENNELTRPIRILTEEFPTRPSIKIVLIFCQECTECLSRHENYSKQSNWEQQRIRCFKCYVNS